jgi:hypothetical protein
MFSPVTATVALSTPAPVHATWAAFETATRLPEVLPDIAAAAVDPDGRLVPGATIRTVARPDRNVIDMRYDVLAAEPPRRLVLQSSAEGFRAQTTYDFEADTDGGTHVTVTAAVVAERIKGRLVALFWRSLVTQQLERSLRRRTEALLELAEKL